MLAYYFYQADVKNWLWTVISPIILTDDTSPSPSFHCVGIGNGRKTDVPNVCISFFTAGRIFSSFPEFYTVNSEEILREKLFFRKMSSHANENEYLLLSQWSCGIVCLCSLHVA